MHPYTAPLSPHQASPASPFSWQGDPTGSLEPLPWSLGPRSRDRLDNSMHEATNKLTKSSGGINRSRRSRGQPCPHAHPPWSRPSTTSSRAPDLAPAQEDTASVLTHHGHQAPELTSRTPGDTQTSRGSAFPLKTGRQSFILGLGGQSDEPTAYSTGQGKRFGFRRWSP